MTLKFCANLTFLFQDVTPKLIKRYELARQAGFNAVECANPYEYDIDEIVAAKNSAGVKQILINSPIGKYKTQNGYAALTESHYQQEFLEGMDKAVKYAKALNCKIIHIMSGIVNNPCKENHNILVNNLKTVRDKLETAELIGTIEAINQYSLPNYYLNSYDEALEIIKEINSPNIKLQLDIFHLQRTKGDLTNNIMKMFPYTSHIQIAQSPHRGQPSSFGEINYKYIFDLLENMSYDGYIGLEYTPIGKTSDSFDWIQEYGYSLDIKV